MARAIAQTPILKGKDSVRVLTQLKKNDDSPKNKKESERLKSIFNKFKEKGISL